MFREEQEKEKDSVSKDAFLRRLMKFSSLDILIAVIIILASAGALSKCS